MKWKDALEWINHASWSTCVLEEDAKYTFPPSYEVFFTSTEGASSYPFPLLGALDLQSSLKFLSFPHFEHTFTCFHGDLYLPLDLDIPLKKLFLFLFWDHPHTDKESPFWPSIFHHLISSDNKAEIMSSKFKVIVLLPIAIARLSHESSREHNKLMHLSSSDILIWTDDT